jgi:hypothetical protein
MGVARPGPVGLTGPVTPFLTSAISGLRSALECPNLISSNSFAHRLGTGNSALRLARGPVCDGPELRHRQTNRQTNAITIIDLVLHIVKDVVVVFHEAFSCDLSIHPSIRHPSMDGIIQGRKPWQK